MKKILFVYHISAVGGGSYCLLNLLKAINRDVFEPYVLLPQKGPLCDEITKLGIEIVYFPSLTLYPYNKSLLEINSVKSLFRIRLCQKRFAKVLRKVSPDIVYLNTMMLFPYLKTAKQNACKTVIHIREHWPLNEHIKQLNWARKTVYSYADKVIAINRYSASMFPKREATIVYDWIDMDARRNGPTLSELVGEDNARKTIYLFTGGLQPIKGTLEVIRTFSKHIMGNDKRLIVLGVELILSWNGLRGKVKKILSWIGYKTYKEKVIKLCQNDKRIICIPALYDITNLMEQVDGYISYFTKPHANLGLAESIIVKIQAVGAQTDESLEYSDEGKYAWLYKLNDEKEFCEIWKRLDADSGSSNKDMRKGSEIIAEKFSPKRNAMFFNHVLTTLVFG